MTSSITEIVAKHSNVTHRIHTALSDEVLREYLPLGTIVKSLTINRDTSLIPTEDLYRMRPMLDQHGAIDTILIGTADRVTKGWFLQTNPHSIIAVHCADTTRYFSVKRRVVSVRRIQYSLAPIIVPNPDHLIESPLPGCIIGYAEMHYECAPRIDSPIGGVTDPTDALSKYVLDANRLLLSLKREVLLSYLPAGTRVRSVEVTRRTSEFSDADIDAINMSLLRPLFIGVAVPNDWGYELSVHRNAIIIVKCEGGAFHFKITKSDTNIFLEPIPMGDSYLNPVVVSALPAGVMSWLRATMQLVSPSPIIMDEPLDGESPKSFHEHFNYNVTTDSTPVSGDRAYSWTTVATLDSAPQDLSKDDE